MPKKSHRKWIIILAIVLIIVIFIGYRYFSASNKSVFETVTVVYGNVVEEVTVTGNVKPVKSVDLAFEKSGRVSEVNIEVGDKVYAGEALVSLEKTELTAQLSKAEADLTTQEAGLRKSKIDLDNYYDDIADVLNDAYAKADDAVRKQLDELFRDDDTSNPTLTFSTKEVSIDNDVRQLRLAASPVLNQWRDELDGINRGISQKTRWQYLQNSSDYLNTIRSLLLRSLDAVESAASISALSASSAGTYKTNINTGRTNVNAALTSVTTQRQLITAQEATIASLEAGIKSYEASVQNIKAQIGKLTLYTPISGVVTVQNAKVGEIASANSNIVSIISANRFEVEANIPEADIAKVKIGNIAEITLDTYGNDIIFEAKVVSVEPAETMIEGVATYKTKFEFLKADKRVKSGMTANITVFTGKKENVLIIPQRTVITKNGDKLVSVDIGDNKSEERKIKTGLRGADGNLEVIEGLREGERVIINL